jgi:hypothetical protein
MRWLARFIGLLLAAGAFVAFVIDGARSIADNAVQTEPVGAVWVAVHEPSFTAAQAAVQRDFSPVLWDRLVQPFLMLPFFVVLVLLAAVFLILGRRPRSRIGYAVRG